MRDLATFLVVCLAAALVPWLPLPRTSAAESNETPFPGWIQQWDGRELRRLPLSEREKRFATGFPGKIARFTDGERQFVIRWVRRRTRQLHPAIDCFRGSGYEVEPRPARLDPHARRWGCFAARRSGEALEVCERISDGAENSWTDVSAWYWAAALGESSGPWWAVTMVRPLPEPAVSPGHHDPVEGDIR